VDLLSGGRVRATPDRYELRPVGEGARADAGGDGWTVRSASVDVEYELVDRRTGDVVMHDRAHLACGMGARDVLPASAAVGGREVIELVPGRVFRGATLTRGMEDDAGSCGGRAGPEQWYVVHLAAPAHLGLRLVSEFDAALYVREGSIDGPEIACRDQAALLETLETNLEAGTYYVAVDGSGTHGRYRLVSFEETIDPRALESVPRGEMGATQREVAGEIVAATSRYRASCGGDEAPEHVYALRLDAPTRVALTLASRFDAALYLVAADGAELDCASTLGFSRAVRRSIVGAELDTGLYYVIVDGESRLAGTGRYRLTLAQHRL
jgi:hypothetical protein